MIKAAIVGANGYTGFELMKRLAAHPQVTVTAAVSRSNEGTKVRDLYPPLGASYGDLTFCAADAAYLAQNADVAFTCLPHAASAALGGQLADAGVKVIDLSADFRYTDVALYERTYNVTHPRPDLNKEAVYGLTELNRDKIKTARIIGNPGCYTTASILPLYTLLKEGLTEPQGINIDSKSGVTGAGRKAELSYNLCETAENFKAYAVTTHRHTTEIEEKLSFGRQRIALSFTPHLLPVKRGILATIYARPKNGVTAADLAAAYATYYGNERFVHVCPEGTLPELKWVVGSNLCAIGYKWDERLGQVIVVSVIDNLLKGASGQAVQNMNVLFGLPEYSGLPLTGRYL